MLFSSAKLRFGYVLLLALSLTACLNRQSSPQRLVPTVSPLPQDPYLEAYFNQSQASSYIEPYRKQPRLGDNLEQIIINGISEASLTVDVAVQELRLPDIAAALVERHQAGVKVRVIIENTYNRPWGSLTASEVAQLSERESDRYSEFVQLTDINMDGDISQDEINQRDALVMLSNAGVPRIDDTADGSKGSGLMHHKFVIVDGRSIIVSSANFTTSGLHGDFSEPNSRGNANNLLKIESAELAQIFTEEFNILWGDGPAGKPDSKFGVKKPFRPNRQISIGNTKVTVQFAPTSSLLTWQESVNGLINQTLAKSDQSIDLALFVFSSQQLVNTLENQSQKGVLVKGLIDPSFAYRSYSEGLDMMGIALANKCKYEENNRPWQKPISTIGVPNLPPGDRLHHKFGIIDNKIIITGSHNWSEAANKTNDEILLVIENSTVAAHFQREFQRLYQTATLGIPSWVIKTAQQQQKECGNLLIETPISEVNTQSKINLNTATLEELITLPGVGPKLAERIIEARQEKSFTSLADLDNISGIGAKMLDKLSDRVTW
ncbi:MAG: phospholipase D-like domain-containing protein [Microcoleaceae cyanobacterium MO_207.B10]|nr:phospholipase D-like domain-containing protein [Microcoleaceae cyanobacterium MO_207.B10]